MNRLKLIFMMMLSLFLASGCDLDFLVGDKKTDEEIKAEAAAEAARAAQNRAYFEAMIAEPRAMLNLTSEEKNYLDAAVAVNASGSSNGIFTNQDGQSGYFNGYDKPFNFRWTGGTIQITAFDGRKYHIINGPGELVVKQAGQSTALQKYKGEIKEGLWHGQGQYWSLDGSLSYEGRFEYDHMSGLGTFTRQDYDEETAEISAYIYEGEMSNDTFHGQGTFIDKATGQMRYKGLWFEDFFFENNPGGSSHWNQWLDSLDTKRKYSQELAQLPDIQAKWKKLEELRELYSVDRQYKNVLQTGAVDISGKVNDTPGEGLLTVIPAKETSNVVITDQAGHTYPVEPIIHPLEKDAKDKPRYVNGSLIEAAPDQYPLTLTISYDEDGRREHLRVTVKRPFIMTLNRASD